MSELVACQNSYCSGFFTVSESPDPEAVCSVCGMTWDEAARAEDLANQEAPGLHVATDTDTELKRWAHAQVMTPPIDYSKEQPKLLEWYKQFDELKSQPGGPRKEKAWFEKVVAVAKNDPELNNPALRFQSVTFTRWLKRNVIEANNRAWPAHDDYDAGESLRWLVACTKQDRALWDACQAAIQDLEHPPPEVDRFLRFPVELLRDRIHEIADDESGAFDAESKASRAEFEALWANPITRAFFQVSPSYEYISDPLYRWAADVCAGRIPRPRGYPARSVRRDARVIRAIERYCELGLNATRNDASPAHSACDVVAAVLRLEFRSV